MFAIGQFIRLRNPPIRIAEGRIYKITDMDGDSILLLELVAKLPNDPRALNGAYPPNNPDFNYQSQRYEIVDEYLVTNPPPVEFLKCRVGEVIHYTNRPAPRLHRRFRVLAINEAGFPTKIQLIHKDYSDHEYELGDKFSHYTIRPEGMEKWIKRHRLTTAFR